MLNVFRYSFAITLLWIGFILAISFVETPVRFEVESLKQADVLAIGHRVFHALNYAEIGFATIIAISLFATRPSALCLCVAGIAIAILAVQTWMLFGILDERTLAKIAGEELPDSPWHLVYIGLELIKLAFLTGLASMQIRQFAQTSCPTEQSVMTEE